MLKKSQFLQILAGAYLDLTDRTGELTRNHEVRVTSALFARGVFPKGVNFENARNSKIVQTLMMYGKAPYWDTEKEITAASATLQCFAMISDLEEAWEEYQSLNT